MRWAMNTEQAWAGPLRLVSQAVIYIRLFYSFRVFQMSSYVRFPRHKA